MSRAKKLLIALIALVLFIGVALFLVSPSGLRLLTPVLERKLARVLHVPVEMDGLVLRWPLQMELEHFRAADDNVTYLELDRARVRISLRQLLLRNVWLHHVRAERIVYNGLPAALLAARPDPEPDRDRRPMPDPAVLIARITVLDLNLDEVEIGDRILSQTARFGVAGAFISEDDGKHGRLSVKLRAWGQEEWSDDGPSLEWNVHAVEAVRAEWLVSASLVAGRWGPLVPNWPATVDDALRARIVLDFEAGKRANLRELDLASSIVKVKGSGSFDVPESHLDARVEIMASDISVLSAWLDPEMEGAVTAVCSFTGNPIAPALDAFVRSDSVRIADHRIVDIEARLEADALDVMSRGELSAQAIVDDLPVRVSGLYRLDPSLVAVSRARVHVLNALLTGDAEYALDTRTFQGMFHLETDDVSELAAHWDVEAAGRGEAVLRAERPDGRQHIILEALISEVEVAQGRMESLSVEAALADLFGEPTGYLWVRLHDLAAGDLQVQEVDLAMAGDTRIVDIELNGQGELIETWTISSKGALQLDDLQLRELRIDEFGLRHRDFALVLEDLVRFSRTEEHYAIDRLALRIGEGRLLASGSVRADYVEMDASLEDLPLSTFGFAGVGDAHGDMEGRFQMSGHPADPAAELSLQFSGLKPADTNFWDGPPAFFSVTAWLENGRLSSRSMLEGLTGRPVELDLNFPLQVALYPVHLQWPPEGDVSGHFLAETDLGELATLFVLDVHRLAGLLSVDLALSGTVDEPDVSGHVRVKDGAYEHDRWGTVLRNIDVRLSGRRDRLAIDHLTATDGDRGRLELSGHLLVKPDEEYPFTTTLTLDQFRLLRHDTAHATGRGSLTWEGDRRASRVAGSVTVTPMELRIPERLPAALIDLEYVEINGEEGAEVTENDVLEEVAAHDLSLDVEVAFPDRAFVRGRGLDSEWGGRVHVQGPAREPVVGGSLSVLRGRFVFFGKRLGITRGLVNLDGSFPPRPVIDVVAEARSAGITAILRLSGDLDAPEIQLDSVPEMPEDEILARLLFGREAARITPWQAITMAQAVNQLRGGGSAFDVMGHTRRMLRVDAIELRESEEHEGQAAISVGKYVSDRVYVELERGVGVEQGGRAAVEVELTPTIRMETEMGTNADAGLGLTWSWDF